MGLFIEGIVGKEFEYGVVVFFDLQLGLKFVIWDCKDIVYEVNVVLIVLSFVECILGYNVNSKVEVDKVMD